MRNKGGKLYSYSTYFLESFEVMGQKMETRQTRPSKLKRQSWESREVASNSEKGTREDKDAYREGSRDL